MKTNKTLQQKALEMICHNRVVRNYLTRRSFLWFFNIFFADHMEYDTAPFQYEIMDLVDKPDWKLFCLVAFRSSAKSTLITNAYVLYSVLGMQEKKFVIIFSQTQPQAKIHMRNIRGALEHNEVLKRTLGPFKEETNEWGSTTIVFTRLNARIMVASVNEAVRGVKHLQHRPDLIVVDDPEDVQSARTKEGRDKIYNWFKSEIMPLGSKHTNILVLGNVVHEHCLTMRLKQEITDSDGASGIYREYPIINEQGESMWPGQWPTPADIEAKRVEINNDKSWYREFLLKVIADEDQIIKRDWIHYGDAPTNRHNPESPYRMTVTAVDPGTKNKEGTDPTAIVSAHLYGYGDNARIYISPIYFNGRLDYSDIVNKAKEISLKNNGGARSTIYVESVQSQIYIVHTLEKEGYNTIEIYPQGDKEHRLEDVSALIRNGQVVFHRGCGEIVNQIVNFGVEIHDDLMDAVVMLVNELSKQIGRSGSTWPGPIVGGTPRSDPNPYSSMPRKNPYGNFYTNRF